MGFCASPACAKEPQPNEPFITIDWTLELTPFGQALLFKKNRTYFDKLTSAVEAERKKDYRWPSDENLVNRNIAALFDQFKPHMMTRLPEAVVLEYEHHLINTGFKDDDFAVAWLQQKLHCFLLGKLSLICDWTSQ